MKLKRKSAANNDAPPAERPARESTADKLRGDDDTRDDSGWQDDNAPLHRVFPGTVDSVVPLRITFTRSAYAEVVAHTKENLDAEVAGVLVGEVCEDGELFVAVKAIIRGASTRHGTTHVTFTHETWNQIHATLDRDYPNLQIVGWYHSHPGFGVEFSSMDCFIQENFFTAPTQFALVTDPLGGAVAICLNRDGGIIAVDRFWVEGREHQCSITTAAKPAKGKGAAAASGKSGTSEVEALQKRIGQLTGAVDELRTMLFRFLLASFLVIALAVMIGICYIIFQSTVSARKPPDVVNFIPVPVKIGDKVVMLGVGLLSWDVPPELVPQTKPTEKAKPTGTEKGAAPKSPADEMGPR